MKRTKRILGLLMASLFMIVFLGCGEASETGDTADISEKIIETEKRENVSDNIEESDINTETEVIF